MMLLYITCNHYFSYDLQTLAGIFDKFKEKKLNVVNSLREAADAAYLTVSQCGTAQLCPLHVCITNLSRLLTWCTWYNTIVITTSLSRVLSGMVQYSH